jgi:hypothetical protein
VLTALLCAAQLHVQASSIRAVLSAGGLRNERRLPETWNAGALGCDEVMGSGFTVAMKALGSRDNPGFELIPLARRSSPQRALR